MKFHMLHTSAIEGSGLQVHLARILIEDKLVECWNHSKAEIMPSLYAIDKQSTRQYLHLALYRVSRSHGRKTPLEKMGVQSRLANDHHCSAYF